MGASHICLPDAEILCFRHFLRMRQQSPGFLKSFLKRIGTQGPSVQAAALRPPFLRQQKECLDGISRVPTSSAARYGTSGQPPPETFTMYPSGSFVVSFIFAARTIR